VDSATQMYKLFNYAPLGVTQHATRNILQGSKVNETHPYDSAVS